MNNYLFSTLILLSFLGNSQTQEATLHFNDGTSIEGYGLIFQEYKIKFRASLEDEPDVWDGTIVSGITFHGFEYDVEFGYVYAKNHERYPLLLEVLTEGEVTLYANVINKTVFSPPLDGDIPLTIPHSFSKVKYYVKREQEKLATKLKGRFKKCIIAYFGECSGLIKGIDNHEFRWATMIDLVNYYNDFCTDE
ncbi:MAG: hypothetical protein ACX93I_00805 [Winogradskyella sp.]|jgi:hypothetical protein